MARPVARRLRGAPSTRPAPRWPTAPGDDGGWSESWRTAASASRMPLPRSHFRGRAAWGWPAPSSTGFPATPCSSSAPATRCVTSTSRSPARRRRGVRQPWPRRHRRRRLHGRRRRPEPPGGTDLACSRPHLPARQPTGSSSAPTSHPRPHPGRRQRRRGGIFTTLEHGAPERAADFERVFGTPTGTDLGALCRAHGIRHDLVATAADLSRRSRAPTASAWSRSPSTGDPPAGARRPAALATRTLHDSFAEIPTSTTRSRGQVGWVLRNQSGVDRGGSGAEARSRSTPPGTVSNDAGAIPVAPHRLARLCR